MSATRQSWLAAHPYLGPIAVFDVVVREAASRIEPIRVEPPRWEAWAAFHDAGVPLLHCAAAGLRFAPAAAYVLGHVCERAAETLPPGGVAGAMAELRDELRGRPERRALTIDWVVRGAPPGDGRRHAGLLRLLGWTAIARVLGPVLADPDARRAREGWGRGACPTCGALPVVAHLPPGDGPRTRLLVCACCGTRWPYPRFACPFCGTPSPERLRLLEVEGDAPLRIDACEECRAYVKTYLGRGDEELFLSDWSTLHLDVVAMRRGLRRVGASLYELPQEGGIAA